MIQVPTTLPCTSMGGRAVEVREMRDLFVNRVVNRVTRVILVVKARKEEVEVH